MRGNARDKLPRERDDWDNWEGPNSRSGCAAVISGESLE